MANESHKILYFCLELRCPAGLKCIAYSVPGATVSKNLAHAMAKFTTSGKAAGGVVVTYRFLSNTDLEVGRRLAMARFGYQGQRRSVWWSSILAKCALQWVASVAKEIRAWIVYLTDRNLSSPCVLPKNLSCGLGSMRSVLWPYSSAR